MYVTFMKCLKVIRLACVRVDSSILYDVEKQSRREKLGRGENNTGYEE